MIRNRRRTDREDSEEEEDYDYDDERLRRFKEKLDIRDEEEGLEIGHKKKNSDTDDDDDDEEDQAGDVVTKNEKSFSEVHIIEQDEDTTTNTKEVAVDVNSEIDELEEKYTFRWEEALETSDEGTYRILEELSECRKRLFDLDNEVRDICILQLAAAYSMQNMGSSLRFVKPIKFAFDDFWSNHFVYALGQWCYWWSWRVWLNSVNYLYNCCDIKNFQWNQSNNEHHLISGTTDGTDCIQKLFQSCCLLENVIEHFLKLWPADVENDDVLPHETYAKFDKPAFHTLQRANSALCQLLGLLDMDTDWTLKQKFDPDFLAKTVKPYHEVFQSLVALEERGFNKLNYLPEITGLAQNCYCASIIRYARMFSDYPMEKWAWSLFDGERKPFLQIHRNWEKEKEECNTVCRQLKLPDFMPTPEFLLRIEVPIMHHNQSSNLILVRPQLIDPVKLPQLKFKVGKL